MSVERLSFQEAIAQISQLPQARLEGMVQSYSGNALRVDVGSKPYMIAREGRGARVAELFQHVPVPAVLDGEREVKYLAAASLDGRLQVTKKTTGAFVHFTITGQIVDPKDSHRTFYYSYTVRA